MKVSKISVDDLDATSVKALTERRLVWAGQKLTMPSMTGTNQAGEDNPDAPHWRGPAEGCRQRRVHIMGPFCCELLSNLVYDHQAASLPD